MRGAPSTLRVQTSEPPVRKSTWAHILLRIGVRRKEVPEQRLAPSRSKSRRRSAIILGHIAYAAFGVPSSNRARAARLLALIAEMLTRLRVMPDHAADIARGKESGLCWARDQAQRSEIDQLRYMYKQQAPSEAGEQMSHWDRCLTIADEIGSTTATKWQTLWSGDWRERRDRFWRAGFVEGALEVRGKRNRT
jgi:hypothetical protein